VFAGNWKIGLYGYYLGKSNRGKCGNLTWNFAKEENKDAYIKNCNFCMVIVANRIKLYLKKGFYSDEQNPDHYPD
jgi:hypothetical protein